MNPYPAQIPKAPGRPSVNRVARQETSGLGVAAEGDEGNGTGTVRPLSFSSCTRDSRFVDVFNTGFLDVGWAAEASHPWVRPATTVNGRAAWPEGSSRRTGTSRSTPRTRTARVARGGARRRTVRGLGRRTGAVEAVPSTAAPVTADFAARAPELRQRVRFGSTGTFPVAVFRLPSLDERGHRRVALCLDDPPVSYLAPPESYHPVFNPDPYGRVMHIGSILV